MAKPQKNEQKNGLFQYRNLMLGTLMVIFTFNFVDRLVFSILQENIKADLGLSDLQIGMVSGLAFAVFFAVMGIPIAWAADRYNRVNIITISLALWSLFTAACGWTNSFWQLFLVRVGVGFGEAGCSPPAYSIISDSFYPKERARALAVYLLGLPVGALIGILLGGWVAQNYGWRMAFIVVGLPGIVAAIIGRLILREPVRGQLDKEPMVQISFAAALSVLMKSRVFWWMSIAATCLSFGGYALNAWMIPHFERTFSMSKFEVGLTFGLIGLVPTIAGTYAGGWISDRLALRDVRWYAWVPMIAAGIMGPSFYVALQMPKIEYLMMIWVFPAFLAGVWFAPLAAVLQNIFPASMRATSVAVNTLIMNLIGLGGGPLVTGAISSALTLPDGSNEAAALQSALSIIVWVYVLGCVLFFISARFLPESWPAENTD